VAPDDIQLTDAGSRVVITVSLDDGVSGTHASRDPRSAKWTEQGEPFGPEPSVLSDGREGADYFSAPVFTAYAQT
jgi:hypothetical protein